MSTLPVVDTWEIAYRIFAAEFDDASLSYSESDEERAPSYVVTPTGMRLNWTFVAGMSTEVEHVSDEMLHGYIANPTGVSATYAGQYQPGPMAYLDAATPPTFVSLVGKTRIYEPDGADVVYSSVRPESVNTTDADVRDRWTVSAAEATLHRIAVFDEVLPMPYRGNDLARAFEARGVDSALMAGVPRAIDHCGTTRTYPEALREAAVQAPELVAGDHDQVDPLNVVPGDGGDAVLGLLPELDLGLATSINIEVGETDTGKIEADVGGFENESGSKPAVTPDSGPKFDDGVESEAVKPESESEPITEPGSEPESVSDLEPVAAETVATAESQPGVSESEPASEPSTTVDFESEPEPAAESESEPATEPDLTSKPEPESVTDSLNTEFEPDFDDGAPGGFEDDVLNTGTTDAGSFGGLGSETLGDFDDSFGDPDPGAGDSAGSAGSTSAGADDSVDPDGMYKLDEDERAKIEPEFGARFTSGADVDPAGEADIDMPGAGDLTEQLGDGSAVATELGPEPVAATAEPEPTAGSEPEPMPDAASDGDEDEAGADPNADESAESIDLELVVVDTMDDLGDGDGATHDEIIVAVVDEHGVGPGTAEDTIQEAFPNNRYYEPQNDVLKVI